MTRRGEGGRNKTKRRERGRQAGLGYAATRYSEIPSGGGPPLLGQGAEQQRLVVAVELEPPGVLAGEAVGVGQHVLGDGPEDGGLAGQRAHHGVVVGLEGHPLELLVLGLLHHRVPLRHDQDLPPPDLAVVERALPRADNLDPGGAAGAVDDAVGIDVPVRGDDGVLQEHANMSPETGIEQQRRWVGSQLAHPAETTLLGAQLEEPEDGELLAVEGGDVAALPAVEIGLEGVADVFPEPHAAERLLQAVVLPPPPLFFTLSPPLFLLLLLFPPPPRADHLEAPLHSDDCAALVVRGLELPHHLTAHTKSLRQEAVVEAAEYVAAGLLLPSGLVLLLPSFPTLTPRKKEFLTTPPSPSSSSSSSSARARDQDNLHQRVYRWGRRRNRSDRTESANKEGPLFYPGIAVELVGVAAGVEHSDGDDRGFAVVVTPVGDSGRQGEDVSLAEAADLLVLIRETRGLLLARAFLPSLTLGLLDGVERLGAARDDRRRDPRACAAASMILSRPRRREKRGRPTKQGTEKGGRGGGGHGHACAPWTM